VFTVRDENGVERKIDDAPIEEIDLLGLTPQGFVKNKALGVSMGIGRRLFNGLVRKGEKKVTGLAVPKTTVATRKPVWSAPRGINGKTTKYVDAKVIDPVVKPTTRKGRRAIGKDTVPSLEHSPLPTKPSAAGTEPPKVGGNRALEFIKKHKGALITGGAIAAPMLMGGNDTPSTVGATGGYAGATAPTDGRAAMHTIQGVPNMYVDEKGGVQRFELSTPEKTKQFNDKLAGEEAKFGDIAGATNLPVADRVMAAASGGAQGYDDSTRQAILQRGLELLGKANSTYQVSSVASLLNSANAGYVPKQNVSDPYAQLLKQQRAAMNEQKMKPDLGYDSMLKGLVGNNGEAAADNIAGMLGITPDTNPDLYTTDAQGVQTVDRARLYDMLVLGREQNVPVSKLMSAE
jgi:hypothetical protein